MMNDYTNHILNECSSNEKNIKISFCGERLEGLFHFQNVEHLIANKQSEGRLLGCKKCTKIISNLLK